MPHKEHKYHHGNLRAALVEAASRIMAERGVEKVTVREVSEVVGVSRAALYRHFDGKNALLCTVAEQGFRQLRDRLLKESTDPNENCLEKFERLAVTYVRFAMENPRFYRLMFSKGPVTSDPTDELKKAAKEAFVAGLSVLE
ncbi:MAG TPA: TetR/AcrR family transcriptional regulator, partial [Candidatus Krumholzibacterium sp.]|nr:TetR/AcrR family transcriptional regulator [Candidatus Krumholzibacterium sp.]